MTTQWTDDNTDQQYLYQMFLSLLYHSVIGGSIVTRTVGCHGLTPQNAVFLLRFSLRFTARASKVFTNNMVYSACVHVKRQLAPVPSLVLHCSIAGRNVRQ